MRTPAEQYTGDDDDDDGESSANRRDRSIPATPGTQRHQRLMAEGIPEWQWNSVRGRPNSAK